MELHSASDEWKAALAGGRDAERPDPIGGFAFIKMDKDRALMFGGQGSNGRVNEARLFHFEERVRS